jgi:hypothetical protein
LKFIGELIIDTIQPFDPGIPDIKKKQFTDGIQISLKSADRDSVIFSGQSGHFVQIALNLYERGFLASL